MKEDFTPKIVNSLLLVLGWLLARLGLVLVEADELARLRGMEGRPVLPPGFRMFNAELAAAHGIDEAVMLSTFSGWIDHNIGKGRQPWTYNSAEKWVEQEFPWMSVSTYRRKVKKLGEAGLLDVCQQAQSFDRRLRVSLTTAARLNTSSSQAERPCIQNEQMVLPFRPDDLQDSEQTILSRKNITPAAAAHAPTKAAAAAPVICTVRDILDRETADRSADRDRDLEGAAIRHARKPGPSPVPAAPSPRPDELTTELDAQADPVPAAIAAVFAPIVARQLIAQHGAETVAAMIADTLKRDGVKNPAGLVIMRLSAGDRVTAAAHSPQTELERLAGRYAHLVAH
jgi:hypothetical protein